MKVWQNEYLKKCSITKQSYKREGSHDIYRLNFSFGDKTEINLDLTGYDLETMAKGIKPYYIEKEATKID